MTVSRLRRLAGVAGTVRERARAVARRVLLTVGGRRIIVGLGVVFLVAAVWQSVRHVARGQPAADTLILFVLVAAPAAGLTYGGARLPRADVHADFYGTIAGWCLGSCGVIAVGIALYDLQPGGAVANPVQTVPVILAIGCFSGFAAGVHDARARTRARELAHRNRQLERTRRELEATVEQLRSSNERLEQFAYAASHDLQEPLRMVSSYVQLVERRYGEELDADGEEYLEFAVDGADRMRAMIEALLEYSRVETQGAPFEPVDLEAVVEAVRTDLHLQIEESDATIEVGDLPRVHGDRDQLRQVFQNLLDNAIEYSGDEPPHVTVAVVDPEGADAAVDAAAAGDDAAGDGELEAATGDAASGAATLDDAATGDAATDEDRAGDDALGADDPVGDAEEVRERVTLAVRDRGIGIDPAYADRIFDVFERLHSREDHAGTGIGLALCKRIVDRHGGDIWVDSEPGEGATFYLTLPLAEASADAATAGSEEAPVEPAGQVAEH